MRSAVRDTTGRGDITEMEVMAALMRAGRRILRPMSAASRYALVIDEGNRVFTRVQCKTGILRDGRIVFRAYSISGHRSRPNAYKGQIDAFGVYCPQTRQAYLVPMTVVSACSTTVALRVSRARNGQIRGVRPASDYVI